MSPVKNVTLKLAVALGCAASLLIPASASAQGRGRMGGHGGFRAAPAGFSHAGPFARPPARSHRGPVIVQTRRGGGHPGGHRPGLMHHGYRGGYYVSPPPVVVTYPVVIEPPPVPSYYTSAPVVTGAPAPMIVAAPPPRPRRFGLGVRASSLQIDGGELNASGGGLLMRVRQNRTEAELDLGGADYVSGRTDSRLSGALYVNFGSRTLYPYVMAGAGVNVISQEGIDATATQGFVEAGVGLGLRLGERFSLGFDVRLGERRLADDEAQAEINSCCQATGIYLSDQESTAEARFAGLIWF